MKRQNSTPLKLLKVTLGNENQWNMHVFPRRWFGKLWIRTEIGYRPPKGVQFFKCLKFGRISTCCESNDEYYTICSQEDHNHKNCTNREKEKCKNLMDVTRQLPGTAQSRQKLEELCSPKQNPTPMLAPVIRRQRKSIQNMLIEKQDLNSKKLRRNFEEISSVTNL